VSMRFRFPAGEAEQHIFRPRADHSAGFSRCISGARCVFEAPEARFLSDSESMPLDYEKHPKSSSKAA
jgi:hypothetical protein